MARKQYDLGKGSVLFGEALKRFGVQPLGGKRYHAFGGFASGRDIANYIANAGYNPRAGVFQATQPVGGRREFIGTDVVMTILQYLEDEVPFEKWGIPETPQGQIFQFSFPAGFFGEISKLSGAEKRFGIFMRQRTMISNALSDEILEYMQSQVPMVQEIIASVIEERVYDKDVELIRYLRRGKPTDTSAGSNYERSYNLLEAFTSEVRATPTGITFGVDESLAPYWLWVEQGHRVILPVPDGMGGHVMMETGTFVKGRPFIEEINTRVSAFLDDVMAGFSANVVSSAAEVIAQWVAGGKEMVGIAGAPKTVKYFPKMGYGEEFQRYVGLIR